MNYDSILKTFSLTHIDVPMIVVSAVAFVVLWKLLAVFLFGPYLQLIEAREAATSGSIELAKKLTDEAGAVREQYDTVLFEVRKTANESRLASLLTARSEAASIIKTAEDEARKISEAAKAELSKKLVDARSKMQTASSELSSSVVSKVNSQLLQ